MFLFINSTQKCSKNHSKHCTITSHSSSHQLVYSVKIFRFHLKLISGVLSKSFILSALRSLIAHDMLNGHPLFICMYMIFINGNSTVSPTTKHISIITFRERVINSIQKIRIDGCFCILLTTHYVASHIWQSELFH